MMTRLFWIIIIFLCCFTIVSSSSSTAFFVDNDDAQSVPLHVNKKVGARLESHILELLGIENHGSGIRDELATRFMAQLYKKTEEDFALNPAYKYLETGAPLPAADEKAIELGEADTITSFLPRVISDQNPEGGSQLVFDRPEIPNEGRLLHAELRVSFETVSKPSSLIAKFQDLRVSDFSLSENGQFFVNITEALNTWAANPAIKPVVTVFAISHKNKKCSLSNFGKWHSFGIASFADSGRQSRNRAKRNVINSRHYVDNSAGSFTTLKPKPPFIRKSVYGKECRRRTLYVDFKYLNWQDWVIAPDGFYAHYCDGSCSFPLTSHMNATNHAIVQTLVYLIDPKRTTEPKCAPSTLKSMKILFIDYSRNVILKRYRDMRVEDCGCQ